MKYKYSFAKIPWNEVASGAKQKVQVMGGTQIRLLRLDYGFVEKDWCLKSHRAFVLGGELEIDFNGDIQIFKEGDGFIIEAGEINKHKAIIKKGGHVELLLMEELV